MVDDSHDPGNAAGDHRQKLFRAVTDAEGVEHPDRRQQSAEMSEEDHQDTDMEQHGAGHELAPPQELA